MEFTQETYTEFIEDAKELTRDHCKEITGEEIDLDHNYYLNAEKLGMIKVFTFRVNGEMIGYALFFVHCDPHRRSLIQAYCDSIYIKPERRGIGMVFVNWCDGMLELMGAHRIYHFVDEKINWSKSLETLLYRKIGSMYCKRLDA